MGLTTSSDCIDKLLGMLTLLPLRYFSQVICIMKSWLPVSDILSVKQLFSSDGGLYELGHNSKEHGRK